MKFDWSVLWRVAELPGEPVHVGTAPEAARATRVPRGAPTGRVFRGDRKPPQGLLLDPWVQA